MRWGRGGAQRLPAGLCLALGLLLAGVRPAAAAPLAGEPPQIYTIAPRTTRLHHQLHLVVGLLPDDPLALGVGVGAGYTYHFSSRWAWEVVQASYSFDVATALPATLARVGTAASQGSQHRRRLLLGSSAVFKPLYGKLALFNRAAAAWELAILAGAGGVLAEGGSQRSLHPALHAGGQVHVWLADSLALRLELRDVLLWQNGGPSNGVLLTMGVSLNFGRMAAGANR